MLDNETKRRIDTARDILVGKVPDPKSQVEQITIALIYKFMDDMDAEAEELGGKRKFFSGEFDRYGWKKLMAPDLGGFDVLTLYAEAIQKMNINPNIPQLFRDIFKNAYLPYRDPETLKSFLKIIDDFEYTHSEKLGDAFEYLLSVLGSQGDAGQFRTPRHIIDFMVDIIDPKKDETILDPACGTAGFLISSYKHILKHNSTNFVPEKDKEAFEQTDVSIAELSAGGTKRYGGDKLTPDEKTKLAKNITGYDISPDMVRLSLVNLYLHGFTDPKIFEYDTLTSEDNWNEYADIVLANPPFMSPKGGIKPHKRFSIQSNRSEVLFVDYMVEHLTPNGKAAIIVPEGIIFQSGNAYKQLRKMLVENYLFAVVSLPAGVFQPYSGVKTSILLIDKALNKKTDKILFVKIENDGFDLGAQRRPNNKSQLPTAVKLVKEYILLCHTERSRSVNDTNIKDIESLLTEKFGPNNLWNIATKEKIAENDDWNLSGERYKDKKVLNSSHPLVRIGEVCSVERGASPRPIDDYITNDKEGVNWIKIGDGSSSSMYISTTKEKITADGAKKSKAVKKGDFILSNSMSFGHPYILDIDGCIHDGWLLLRPNEGLYIKEFLYQILSSENVLAQFTSLATGGVVNNLNSQLVRQVQIPLPPLEIQKEIVAEIEGWQKIIDGARQVVENYKPQIDIDPEWPMVELAEVCEINKETAIPSELYGKSSFTYVDITSVENGTGEISFNNVMSTEEAPSRARRVIKKKDILLSTVRPNLKAFAYLNELPEKPIASTGFAVLTTKSENDAKYIYYSLLQDYMLNQMISNMGKGAYPSINQKDVSELQISLPSIDTQKTISSMIDKENEIVNYNKQLIKLFEQKIKDKIAKVWGE